MQHRHPPAATLRLVLERSPRDDVRDASVLAVA